MSAHVSLGDAASDRVDVAGGRFDSIAAATASLRLTADAQEGTALRGEAAPSCRTTHATAGVSTGSGTLALVRRAHDVEDLAYVM